MAAFLVLSDGARFQIEDGMVIGRGASCEIVIKDAKASRRHARLIFQGGVVEIEDLESSNGTRLNGKSITKRMMRVGDVVTIGTTDIRYTEEDALEPSVPAESAADFVEEVLEFADDDVVTVRRSIESDRTKQDTATPPPSRESTVLQFNRIEDRKGFAAQDLGQMSTPVRLLLYLVVFVVAAGLFYLTLQIVS